ARFLADADPEVRRTAIQWIGEARLRDFAPRLGTSAAQAPVTPSLFQALLAANHLLANRPENSEPIDQQFVAQIVRDAKQPAAFRVPALQLLRPDHPAL